MAIINRIGVLNVPAALNRPRTIVLHDTVSPTVRSAEHGLEARGLGYHFIIDFDGTTYQYAPVNKQMWHASGWNRDTLGISFIGGGKYGTVTDDQVQALLDLVEEIRPSVPKLTRITCHKFVSNSGKIDPRWEGQPEDDWSSEIDVPIMTAIADRLGLEFFDNGKER